MMREWRVDLVVDDLGQVGAALYEVTDDGQGRFLDVEAFGPFDTASDVSAWLVRHWAPRARLPLR